MTTPHPQRLPPRTDGLLVTRNQSCRRTSGWSRNAIPNTGTKRKHSDMTAEDVAAALEGHRPAGKSTERQSLRMADARNDLQLCCHPTLDQLLDDLDITQPLHRKALMDFFE